MKKYRLLVFMWVALSSCGIYRQNVVNVPLMQQKGQAQAGGHISFNGYDGQASYAVTKNIGILANYSDMGHRREDFSQYNYTLYQHYFGEIGLGMYKQTKKGNIQEGFFLAGKGMTYRANTGMDRTGTISTKTQKVRYSRFLLQGDFGNTRKKLQVIFSPRLLFIHYFDIQDNSSQEYKDLSHSYVYAEVAGTLRYQLLPFFIISGQACSTLSLAGKKSYNYYEFSPYNFSIGLVFNRSLLKPDNKK